MISYQVRAGTKDSLEEARVLLENSTGNTKMNQTHTLRRIGGFLHEGIGVWSELDGEVAAAGNDNLKGAAGDRRRGCASCSVHDMRARLTYGVAGKDCGCKRVGRCSSKIERRARAALGR